MSEAIWHWLAILAVIMVAQVVTCILFRRLLRTIVADLVAHGERIDGLEVWRTRMVETDALMDRQVRALRSAIEDDRVTGEMNQQTLLLIAKRLNIPESDLPNREAMRLSLPRFNGG